MDKKWIFKQFLPSFFKSILLRKVLMACLLVASPTLANDSIFLDPYYEAFETLRLQPTDNINEIYEAYDKRINRSSSVQETAKIEESIKILQGHKFIENITEDTRLIEIRHIHQRIAQTFHPDKYQEPADQKMAETMFKLLRSSIILIDLLPLSDSIETLRSYLGLSKEVTLRDLKIAYESNGSSIPNDPRLSHSERMALNKAYSSLVQFLYSEADMPSSRLVNTEIPWRNMSDPFLERGMSEEFKKSVAEEGKINLESTHGKIRVNGESFEGRFWYLKSTQTLPIIFEVTEEGKSKGRLFITSKTGEVFELGGEFPPSTYQRLKSGYRWLKNILSGNKKSISSHTQYNILDIFEKQMLLPLGHVEYEEFTNSERSYSAEHSQTEMQKGDQQLNIRKITITIKENGKTIAHITRESVYEISYETLEDGSQRRVERLISETTHMFEEKNSTVTETKYENNRQTVAKRHQTSSIDDILRPKTSDSVNFRDYLLNNKPGASIDQKQAESYKQQADSLVEELLRSTGYQEIENKGQSEANKKTAAGEPIDAEAMRGSSPRNINQQDLAFFTATFQGNARLPHKGTFWNTTKRFPLETIAFYAALGAITLATTIGSDRDLDPADTFIDMISSPLGAFSFYAFMLASSVLVGKPFMMLINKINQYHNAYLHQARTTGRYSRSTTLAYNKLAGLFRFLMMPIGLAAGMYAHTIVYEYIDDPDRKACSEGLKNPGPHRGYNNFIKSCERLYNNWTLSNKLPTHMPDVFGLIASAFIANKALTPLLTATGRQTVKLSRKMATLSFASQFKSWVKEQMEKFKNNPGKNIGKTISKFSKYPLQLLRSIMTFIPFLATAHAVNDLFVIDYKKNNLINVVNEQIENIKTNSKTETNWDRFSTKGCIFKENPVDVNETPLTQHFVKGLERSLWQPKHFSDSFLFYDYEHCSERHRLHYIDAYANNWNEWRFYALNKFMTAHQNWLINGTETFYTYSWVKNTIFNFYKNANSSGTEEYLTAYPFFGVNQGQYIKTPLENENDILEFTSQVLWVKGIQQYGGLHAQNSQSLKDLKPSFEEDVLPHLKLATEYIKDTKADLSSQNLGDIISGHPDKYLKDQYTVLNSKVLGTLHALWRTCGVPYTLEYCKKKAAAGIQLLNQTFNRIKGKADSRSRKLKKHLPKIQNILVCGTKDDCPYSHFLNAYPKGMLQIALQNASYKKDILGMRENRNVIAQTFKWFEHYPEHPVEYYIKQMACGVDVNDYSPPSDLDNILSKDDLMDQLPLYREPLNGPDQFIVPRVTKEKAPKKICDEDPKVAMNKTFDIAGKEYTSLLDYVKQNKLPEDELNQLWIEKIEPQHILHSQFLKRKYRNIVNEDYKPSVENDDIKVLLDMGKPSQSSYKHAEKLKDIANDENTPSFLRGFLATAYADTINSGAQADIVAGVAEDTVNTFTVADKLIAQNPIQNTIQSTGSYQSLPAGVLNTFPEQATSLFEIIEIVQEDKKDVTRRLFDKEQGKYITLTKQEIINKARDLTFPLIEDFIKYNKDNLNKTPTFSTNRYDIMSNQEQKQLKMEDFTNRTRDIIVLLQQLIETDEIIKNTDDWNHSEVIENYINYSYSVTDRNLKAMERIKLIENVENNPIDQQKFIQIFKDTYEYEPNLNFNSINKYLLTDEERNIDLIRELDLEASIDNLKQEFNERAEELRNQLAERYANGEFPDTEDGKPSDELMKEHRQIERNINLLESENDEKIKHLIFNALEAKVSLINKYKYLPLIKKYNHDVLNVHFMKQLPNYIKNKCFDLKNVFSYYLQGDCNTTLFTVRDQTTIALILNMLSLFSSLMDLTQQIDIFTTFIHQDSKQKQAH